MRLFLAVLSITALFLAQPGKAQDGPAADRGGDRIGIGLGLGSVPDYEGSSHSRLVPVPGAAGRISGIEFLLIGNRLSADLVPRAPDDRWDIQLGPVVAIGLNRTDADSIDDPRVRALGKVKAAIDLGGYVGIGRIGVLTSAYDRLSLSVSYRHDVAGANDGVLISPAVNYLMPVSPRVVTTFYLSATHADGHFARTYFGLTPAQSQASGLPVFDAGSGWKDWSAGGAVAVALRGDVRSGLLLVMGAGYSRLLNDFAASPVTSIAGTRGQWLLGAGLAYTF